MSNFNVAAILNSHTKKPIPLPDPSSSKKILFVCTGNIARSASAKYLARSKSSDESGWGFDSAGIGAVIGAPVAPFIDDELHRRGIRFEDHKAQQITERMVEESLLVLVMEKLHRDWILREWPQYRNKVYLLKQMQRLRKEAGQRAEAVSYLSGIVAGPRRKDEVADPYRRGAEAARVAVEEIEEALGVILPWLGVSVPSTNNEV